MSGHDASQSTFDHELKPLPDFEDDEPSEEELLNQAYENGERKRIESGVEDEFYGRYTTPFSTKHRRLNTYYPVTDIDYLYYTKVTDEIWLIVENKFVRERPFDATTVVKTTPSDYQERALRRLGQQCNCPVYIRWWTLKDNADEIDEKADKPHDTLYVRELGSDGTPRKLVGQHEHMDWLDEYRPSAQSEVNND